MSYPTITGITNTPNRTDRRETFNSDMAQTFVDMNAMATSANAWAAYFNPLAVTMQSNADISQAAFDALNAVAWVSGTTYAIGDVVYSPITSLSYRRITNGAGTVDPATDPTNWQVVSTTLADNPTPSVRPTLLSNFMTGHFPMTFTSVRASAADFVDQFGSTVSAANNVARMAYDADGTPRGLMTEDADGGRAADSISRIVSAKFGAAQGTIYIDFEATYDTAASGDVYALDIGNASNANDRICIYVDSGADTLICDFVSNSTVQASFTLASGLTGSTAGKIALSYAANDIRVCMNGGTVQSDTSATITPSIARTVMKVGGETGGATANMPQQFTRDLRLFPRPLTDLEMQMLTAGGA